MLLAKEQEPRSLAEKFLKYFYLQIGQTQEIRRAAYRIRYRVYCEEFGYEDPSHFPDRLEKDEYDEESLHCVIFHRASGMPAGCVRLVPATGPDSTSPLPFERYCHESIDRTRIEQLDIDRTRLCEISRLAVDGAFRRRAGEAKTRFGEVEAMDLGRDELRTFPMISMTAFLAVAAVGDLNGITQGFAMMEPFLPRLLQRSGIHFLQVGSNMQYHGTRAPYFICLEDVLNGMSSELRALYDAIHEQISNDGQCRA